METIAQYRQYIQTLLMSMAQYREDENVEAQTIFDTERDHYQLIYVGWHNKKRVYGPILHLDIKDGKIWIQWNGTESDIAADLEALGVPKDCIVLGFHPPIMRQFTDYAIC